MRYLLKTIGDLLGSVAIVAGVYLLLDGLLPLRSRGLKREGYQFVLSEWSSKVRGRKRLVKITLATGLWMIASQIAGLVP